MRKIGSIAITLLLAIMITFSGCSSKKGSNHEELTSFRQRVDEFCESIYKIDSNINEIDTSADNYSKTLLQNLDALQTNFKIFADMDFPSDYDYLEGIADEASNYMNTAVEAFHDVFENNYTEEAMVEKYNYANENYERAYKRIKIIITFLNGETSEDVTVEETE
jgi:conjugal transfer/entry exclusion protein